MFTIGSLIQTLEALEDPTRKVYAYDEALDSTTTDFYVNDLFCGRVYTIAQFIDFLKENFTDLTLPFMLRTERVTTSTIFVNTKFMTRIYLEIVI